EFINRQDSVIRSLLLPLTEGLARGDIQLPDTLKAGRCRIRAYTTWMRNFGTDSFFEKVIPIVNGFNLKSTAATGIAIAANSAPNLPDIQFFPEGGDLVENLRSKVGVKVTGGDGAGKELSGEISDQTGKVVAAFRTLHAGIGAFALTPVPGNTYTALIKLPAGKIQRLPLPAAKAQGYVLTVNNREQDSIRVGISANIPRPQMVTLLAQSEQLTCYTIKMELDGHSYIAAVPRSYLPAGIIRLTLQSADGEALAERLVFNDQHDELKLEIHSDSLSLQAGKPVKLQIRSVDKDEHPATGSFSMAVTDQETVPVNEADELTIRADLLLTSDLKGHVEQPNYYFTAKTAADSLERAAQLDNLLLTQGWRRFVWKKQTADSTMFLPEQGLHISGT
ncbi:hypothetical protein I5M19_18540, partial [Mucilaginibacter sp. SD-g]|nr:hypothetical protein [Mucilaginibacter segetis]